MSQSVSRLSAQGTWDVKRKLKLPGLHHERDAQTIAFALQRLPGVLATATDVGKSSVTVVYDITRIDYRRVLDSLAEAGFPVADNWWSRFRTNWLQNLDVTGRENANVPTPPCCSNPKGIATPQRRK